MELIDNRSDNRSGSIVNYEVLRNEKGEVGISVNHGRLRLGDQELPEFALVPSESNPKPRPGVKRPPESLNYDLVVKSFRGRIRLPVLPKDLVGRLRSGAPVLFMEFGGLGLMSVFSAKLPGTGPKNASSSEGNEHPGTDASSNASSNLMNPPGPARARPR
jgi:hypothetical protein